MVARVNPEMFSNALHTPVADPTDSEDIRLALETARVLEAQGDFPEAARWIRRAADAAEKDGKDERVLALARAVADLTASIAASKENAAPPSVPTLSVRGRSGKAPRPEARTRGPSSAPPSASGVVGATGSIPPMLAALISSIPPFLSRESAPPPPTPSSPPPTPSASATAVPSASAAAVPAPAPSAPVPAPPANDVASPAVDKPLTARTMRIGSIRVAISGSLDAKPLSVERLEKGQPIPAGAMEAMLVLTGEIDGSLTFETHLPVTNHGSTKS